MTDDHDRSRRSFVKICTSALVMLGAHGRTLAEPAGPARGYERAQLVDNDNRPIRLSDLVAGTNYVFHYPYAVTPCFLINLGQPTARDLTLTTQGGKSYRWTGGIGPDHSVVAFSAICAHRMSHPAPSVSFINYRHDRVSFGDEERGTTERSGVIYCCSEKSVYDPREGCRVLSGPAEQPLAAIRLEHDSGDGSIYATGSYGGEMFDRFFDKFGFRLALEYRTDAIRELAGGTTP